MIKRIFFLIIIFTYLTSCDFNSSSCPKYSNGSINHLNGIAQLGNLGEATVEIYKIENDGSLNLQWTEYTSDGNLLEEIGRFNSHLEELEENVFYLYKVYGGKDWDSNDDGIKDEIPVKNKGVIRLIAKGSDIKSTSEIRVTIASEIVYEKVAKYLKYNFDPELFSSLLNKEIKSTLDDVNLDGQVDIKDLLSFNPVKNKNDLIEVYRYKIGEITRSIHKGEHIFDKFNYIIGSTDTPGKAISTAILNNIIYVADYTSGVQIVDISDISNPVIINSVSTDSAYDVNIVNDKSLLIVADGASGIKIYDISSPENPSFISFFETIDTAIDIETVRNLIFVVEPSNLQIIDISDPYNPVLKGSFTTDNSYSIELSSDASKAFVADGTSGIKIIDISDPSDPQLTTSFDTDGKSFSLTLSPDETKLYVADGIAGLKVIDITNIFTPVEIGRFNTAWIAYDVVLASNNSKIYISDGYAGVYIVDITDPQSPSLSGVCRTKNNAYKIDKFPDRDIVLVADMDAGIQIMDLKDVKDPYIISSLELPSYAKDIDVSSDGSTVYFASGAAGLQIVDISQPANPEITGAAETSNAQSVILSSDNQKIYLADALDGLKIIDISNPTNPTVIKTIDTPGFAYDVALSADETVAYVADDTQGLHIIDLQTSTILNTVTGFGRPRSVVLSSSQNLVFTTTGLNFTVIDISDTDNPQVINSIDTPGYANDVILLSNETLAYISDATSGITVVDISDPYNLSVLKSIKTGLYASSVRLSKDGNTAYVSASYSGLYIMDITDPLNPTIKKIIKTPGSAFRAIQAKDSIIILSDREFGIQVIDSSVLE
ncbi:Uncharacterized conserved protein [Persephonella hydrogeniphila]|uniref:Uncharacterized conserved protein n=1 Tax=Persephonella hydrogeniphila TaxID=198703 RepID=A0A285NC78_9AQUI|nr:hypothetical protein [Persephonella hydrogeniphila]SNZ07114.1 Uncharacterized conserved protein [Persephonella hydrogeniphila]